jgi:hypothetical protein
MHHPRFQKASPFLDRVPNLATLSVDVEYNEDLIKSIPSGTSKLIPNLVTLRCPPSLVSYLISGRPVTNIDIYRPLVSRYELPESSELIRLIRLSSVPIKVLHLSVNIYLDCACLFGDAFPELEELDMKAATLTCNTRNVRLCRKVFCGSIRYSKRHLVRQVAGCSGGSSSAP